MASKGSIEQEIQAKHQSRHHLRLCTQQFPSLLLPHVCQVQIEELQRRIMEIVSSHSAKDLGGGSGTSVQVWLQCHQYQPN